MYFANRKEAAEKLALRLKHYQGKDPLILAIPRGAVPMGNIIAHALNGELDVVLVRKLGAPGNAEYAIGAVDESGYVQMNAEAGFSLDDPYVQEEVARQLQTIHARRKKYTPSRKPIDPYNRIVIVVDDGIATGSTMLAALTAIRSQKPAKIIVAVGVASSHAIAHIETKADEVVCLNTPPVFYAVGQFFQEFEQVSDEEVITHLQNNT